MNIQQTTQKSIQKTPYSCQHRALSVVNVHNIEQAKQQAQRLCANTVTLIDTTRDFNQNKWLGQELGDTLIYFNDDSKMNGLLALFGCVKAGCRIILACDESGLNDYFKRVILLPQLKQLSLNNEMLTVGGRHHSLACGHSSITPFLVPPLPTFSSATAITHLVGERGSGKSTLLGQWLAQQLTQGKQQLLLSSPLLAASHNTLRVLARSLLQDLPLAIDVECADAQTLLSAIHQVVSRETFDYCLPNALSHRMAEAQIILVDEAATLPKNLLQTLMTHVEAQEKTLLLATTIEGYEGTGQSYRLNYLQTHLNDGLTHSSVDNNNGDSRNNEGHKCQQSVITLDTPKRFSADDPLYQLCQSLYRPTTAVAVSRETSDVLSIEVLTTQALRQRGWTAACFALLRQAHYKTTPNDLARFYSDEALFVVAIDKQRIVGAVCALPERLPDDISARAIFYGLRRAKNALTQQALLHAYGELSDSSLASDKGKVEATGLAVPRTILRISRIAVAKSYRRQHLATRLLATLQAHARGHYDFLSTSFSGSAVTLRFWQSQHFVPVRIGLYPNKANAEYAVLMLQALTAEGQRLQQRCNILFNRHLRYFSASYLPQFTDLLADEQEEIASMVSRETKDSALSKALNEEIRSVVDYHRDINWALPRLSTSPYASLLAAKGIELSRRTLLTKPQQRMAKQALLAVLKKT